MRRWSAALRREEGWLSLAGLFWLSPGTNGIGPRRTAPSCCPQARRPTTSASSSSTGTKPYSIRRPASRPSSTANPWGPSCSSPMSAAHRPASEWVMSRSCSCAAASDGACCVLESQHPAARRFPRPHVVSRPEEVHALAGYLRALRSAATDRRSSICWAIPQERGLPRARRVRPRRSGRRPAGERCRRRMGCSSSSPIRRTATRPIPPDGSWRPPLAAGEPSAARLQPGLQPAVRLHPLSPRALCPPPENRLPMPVEAGELFDGPMGPRPGRIVVPPHAGDCRHEPRASLRRSPDHLARLLGAALTAADPAPPSGAACTGAWGPACWRRGALPCRPHAASVPHCPGQGRAEDGSGRGRDPWRTHHAGVVTA